MSEQWIRYCRLSVDVDGDTVVLVDGSDDPQLRVRFSVAYEFAQTPNSATIIVNNLSEQTAQRIRREGQKLTLEAGYRDAHGTIFGHGEIIQRWVGKENPVDSYLKLVAQHGDTAYNEAVVSKTLAAGSTYRDHIDLALEAMKPFGVVAGFIPDLGSKKMPGPRTFFGMARDVLRDVAIATGASWSIDGNQLNFVKNDKAAEGDTIVLNSSTGMIGRPTQSFDGVTARMLLNTKVRPKGLVKIDEASIDQATFSTSYGSEKDNELLKGMIAADGIYKILTVEHHGDTRGTAWYTDITCMRADGGGTIPLNVANQNITVEPGN